MASLYRKPCKDLAEECVGYKSDGLWNMYAKRLDECNFFAGCGKKNGAVDYCGIAFCYWLFMNVIVDSGEPDDDDRKYMTHYAMYQRDDCCTSAGCTQQAQAYKDNGAWYTNPQDLQVMDQVFFQKSNGDIYHTGACTDFDDNGAYITEANVEGRQTLTRFYPYSEFGKKIAGFGRPRFDGWEQEGSSDDIEPTPEPVPEPIPEPVGKVYTVNVSSWLNVRNGIGTGYPVVDKLYDGDIVTVYEVKDGWGRISNDMDLWVCMDYLS